jgi:hypothetical protein
MTGKLDIVAQHSFAEELDQSDYGLLYRSDSAREHSSLSQQLRKLFVRLLDHPLHVMVCIG